MPKYGTILVIEDNFTNAELLRAGLDGMFEIVHQPDSERWLDSALDSDPCLILLDLNMPHKDGFEVYNEILANKKTKNIPVIILTAYYNVIETVYKLDGLSIKNVFTKPFKFTKLRERIFQLLQIPALNGQQFATI
ncbi:MAG: response regulator [Candidatus Nanoarchaeia archaeon]|nr:response regulator [Candidatus Nanoarchaeia archaeon]